MANLTFKSNGATQVALIKVGSPDPITLKYSTDKLEWSDYQIGVEIPLSNSSLYLSGNNDHFSKNIQNRYQFVTSGEGELTVKGDIEGLSRIEDFAFNSLFSGCANIVDANGLRITDINIPPSKARKWTFANMFMDCINLRTPPSSFTNVRPGMWCYSSTFGNCISLTAVPRLLTQDATTITPYSHYCMFYNCKSLSSAPHLHAFHLADWCYNSMFYGCTSLTSISADFIDWNTSGNSTKNWVTGIETEGKFYNDNVAFIYGVDNVPETWKIDYSKIPLTFKSTGNTTVRVNKGGMSYNKNNTGWTDYTPDDVISLTDGEIVTFSGTSNNFYKNFITTGNGTLQIFGNCNSIINYRTQLTNNELRGLFVGCQNIVDASNLILPATTLANQCYREMFAGCGKLSTAPQLPATELAQSCYYIMFWGCKDLLSTPALPATTLPYDCYNGMFKDCTSLTDVSQMNFLSTSSLACMEMFKGCTSLTGVPNLSATSIGSMGFRAMFENCTSLKKAPHIPQHVAYSDCLLYMFHGCTSLTEIEVDFTEWIGTAGWVGDVAPTGTFTKPTALSTTFGNNYIPDGWRVVNKDVDYTPLTFKGKAATNAVCLSSVGTPSAITLQYNKNNTGWTDYSLCSVIELAENDTVAFSGANDHFSKDGINYYNFAMTGTIEAAGNIQSLMNYSDSVTSGCYFKLFSGCISLTKAPQLPATTLAHSCYRNMFSNCSSLQIAPQLPAETLAIQCYDYMFRGCTSLLSAPSVLPATTLAPSCYERMFSGCISLTKAPQLPATTLANYCYQGMFNSCSNLSSINVAFTDWTQANNATNNWVNGVAANGIFTKSSTLSAEYGEDRIPTNWRIVNK